jgi:hypothetical protein
MIMNRNIGRLDRFIRILIGMALVAYLLKDGTLMPNWPLLGLVGVALLVTAAFSYCPIYDVFNVSSRDRPNRTV